MALGWPGARRTGRELRRLRISNGQGQGLASRNIIEFIDNNILLTHWLGFRSCKVLQVSPMHIIIIRSLSIFRCTSISTGYADPIFDFEVQETIDLSR